MTEKIDHPSHYNQGIECIEYIESHGMGEAFCAGNVIKYVTRYKHKNGPEDLQKARWYLERLTGIVTGASILSAEKEVAPIPGADWKVFECDECGSTNKALVEMVK